MASIPWPEDLCNGRVTWWLGYMIADNYEDDDRYPQLKAGAGIKVNFSPDVAQAVRYNGVTGNKTIMPLVSSGVIGDDGYLYTENEDGSAGELGVILPSSECDTLTPRDWTWTVTVTENRIRINRFSISLSPGETIDLADYAPIDSSGGTHIVTEVETAERAEQAATQAGQFRQETQTDREATQRLRNEAETFRDEAGSSATSSAQSATTAGEILEQMQDLDIDYYDYQPTAEEGVLFNAMRVRVLTIGGFKVVTIAGGYRHPTTMGGCDFYNTSRRCPRKFTYELEL